MREYSNDSAKRFCKSFCSVAYVNVIAIIPPEPLCSFTYKYLLYKPIEINFRDSLEHSTFYVSSDKLTTCSFLYRIRRLDRHTRHNNLIETLKHAQHYQIVGVVVLEYFYLRPSSCWLPNVVLPLACLLSLSRILSKCIF